jgi:putative transposase
MKFHFVQENRETFRVGSMCAELGVSRSGFYAWLKRGESGRAKENAILAEKIRVIHRESRGIYGSPRVYRVLRNEGQRFGKHRVARVMRLEGIRGCARKRFRFTATKHEDMPAAPNRLAQNFTTTAPNRVWVADVTQVRTQEGWLFLSAVLDLYSRRVVGWATAAHNGQELAIEALDNAIRTRRPPAGLVHHSDRGGMYLSTDYQDLLDRNGMICSMSRPGNCLDNAVAESFFHTLKTEWLYHHRFQSRDQARLFIFDYIESFYNRTRLHSTLGYRSPIQYETVAA